MWTLIVLWVMGMEPSQTSPKFFRHANTEIQRAKCRRAADSFQQVE